MTRATDTLEELWRRDRSAAARALGVLCACEPGSRVGFAGAVMPELEAMVSARCVVCPTGAVDHLVVSGPLDGAPLDRLAPAGVLHLATTVRDELAVRAEAGRRGLVAIGRACLRDDGVQSESGDLDSALLLRLARNEVVGDEPVRPRPVALMFDHPRWMQETHAKLRVLLSALGYEIRELTPEEAVVIGRRVRDDDGWRVPDDVVAVGVNRALGIADDVAEMERVIFEGGRAAALEGSTRERAEATYRGVADVMQTVAPELIVTINGTTPMSYAAAAAARAHAVAVLALENSFLRDRFFAEATTGAVGNRHALARFRFDTVGKIPLSDEDERRLDDFLAARDTSSSFDGTIRQDAPIPPAEVRERLGIPATSRIAVLLAQVAFDSVITLDNPHYSSSAEFITAAIEEFAHRPDWTLVVRFHPKEADEGGDCTARRVQVGRTLPENVRLVTGRQMNTYSIMDAASVGLTINSQTGLELTAKGKPCLVAGDAFYGRKGFTRDLASAALLGPTLDELLARPEPDETERIRSRRFLHDLVFAFTVPYALDGMLDRVPERLTEARAVPRPTRPTPPASDHRAPALTVVTAAAPGRPRVLQPEERALAASGRIEVLHAAPSPTSTLGDAVAACLVRARAPVTAVIDATVVVDEHGLSNLLASALAAGDGFATVSVVQVFDRDSWIEAAAAAAGLARGFDAPSAVTGHAFTATTESLLSAGPRLRGAESVMECGRLLGAKPAPRRPADGDAAILATRVPAELEGLLEQAAAVRRGLLRAGGTAGDAPPELLPTLSRLLATLERATPLEVGAEAAEIVSRLARLLELAVRLQEPASTGPVSLPS